MLGVGLRGNGYSGLAVAIWYLSSLFDLDPKMVYIPPHSGQEGL